MTFFPDHIHVPEDPILGMMSRFRADRRPEKCDLGIGVYKDAEERTPVMAAVKDAESRLLHRQDTKAYMGLRGNADYISAVRELVLGDAEGQNAFASAQVPGGSFALSMASMITSRINPEAAVWTSSPGWSSYAPLLLRDRLTARSYPYKVTPHGRLDLAALLDALDAARPGDIVVLQANCHNPTGIDPSPIDWAEIATRLRERSLVPLVDVAYQGLSADPDTDALPVRLILEGGNEAFVAVTNSKNLGLYRERTGCLFVQTDCEATATRVQGLMDDILCRYHAMPPDHGAAVAALVFGDAALRAVWLSELTTMRRRMDTTRALLSEAVAATGDQSMTHAIRAGRGMFTRLPLDAPAIVRLREQHAIYLTGDGRINICGLTDQSFDRVTEPLLAEIISSKKEHGDSLVY